MNTITTDSPEAAEAAPIEGTVAVRPAGTTAATGTQRQQAEPIDGALLWLFVRRYLSTYVSFRTQAELDMVTAWIFHACARRRNDTGMGPLIWNATPRLLILSRKRGAGKSTALTLVSILTGSISGKSARITPAALAQSIAQAHETVCIDEGRLVFGAGAAHQDLQALLIDGYTPESTYRVSKTRLSVFGPVAIASKESLITEATKAVDGDDSSIGDLLERCLKVILVAPDLPMPEIGRKARAEGALLARALVMWTDNMRDRLEQAAEDIAGEDFKDARRRAARGEKVKKNLRADQIGRPLRVIGRIIDQQTAEDQERKGIEDAEPQCEADILAALGVRTKGDPGVEAAELMAELEQLSREWGEGTVDEDEWDEPEGRIVYNNRGGEYNNSDGEPNNPPAAEYRAGYAVTRPGAAPDVADPPLGSWDSPIRAQAACEEHAGEPLNWQPSPRRAGTWGATVEWAGGIIYDYAVTIVTGK
jgi:hypothetical protein